MTDHLQLFTRPTPLEPAPRLATALGLRAEDLHFKRDDLTGLGGGGNKVRKLEVTMAAALRAGASTVITTGAPQSNHARLTAAAAARLGLHAVLVLSGSPPPVRRGNLVLDDLLGAEVVFCGAQDPEAAADAWVQQHPDQRVHRIPFGGSSPDSAQAYAVAAEELLEQAPEVDHVVVAVGSGATMAGLVAGLGAHRVLGVDCGAVPDAARTVTELLRAMRPQACWTPGQLRLDPDQVGDGYEHLTPGAGAAMELVARQEGIVLDPTYTGRAMAGLIHAVQTADISPGERVVFWHTGGLPGLFGHPELR